MRSCTSARTSFKRAFKFEKNDNPSAHAQTGKRAPPPGAGRAPGLLDTLDQDTFELVARLLCALPEDLPSLACLARTAKPLAARIAASALWQDLYRTAAGCNTRKYIAGPKFDQNNLTSGKPTGSTACTQPSRTTPWPHAHARQSSGAVRARCY